VSRSEGINCNVCGRLKLEVNHWLIAVIWRSKTEITFFPASEEWLKVSGPFDFEDICGQKCAHTRLSQFLDSL
jgi:hypothetical protein